MFSRHLRFPNTLMWESRWGRETLSPSQTSLTEGPEAGIGDQAVTARKFSPSSSRAQSKWRQEMLGAGLCLRTEGPECGEGRAASLTPSLTYLGSVFDLGWAGDTFCVRGLQ